MEKYKIFPNVVNNMNFIGLWVLFALFYISNVHRAEKKLRKLDKVQKEIDEVRRAYIYVKDQTMFEGTMYELARNIEGIELDKNRNIPKKIKRS
jgi:hypothetical protein